MFVKGEMSVCLGEYRRIADDMLPCDIPIRHAQLHCLEIQSVSIGNQEVGVAVFWQLI